MLRDLSTMLMLNVLLYLVVALLFAKNTKGENLAVQGIVDGFFVTTFLTTLDKHSIAFPEHIEEQQPNYQQRLCLTARHRVTKHIFSGNISSAQLVQMGARVQRLDTVHKMLEQALIHPQPEGIALVLYHQNGSSADAEDSIQLELTYQGMFHEENYMFVLFRAEQSQEMRFFQANADTYEELVELRTHVFYLTRRVEQLEAWERSTKALKSFTVNMSSTTALDRELPHLDELLRTGGGYSEHGFYTRLQNGPSYMLFLFEHEVTISRALLIDCRGTFQVLTGEQWIAVDLYTSNNDRYKTLYKLPTPVTGTQFRFYDEKSSVGCKQVKFE